MNKKLIFEMVEEYMAKNEAAISPDAVTVGFPSFDHREINAALDCLLDLRLSQGNRVEKFQKEYADYIGTEYAVATNSGSSANLIALSALIDTGYLQRGDEVILPATTFATVISPVLQCGLIPILVDVDLNDLNISPESIENAITDKTGLIIVVHTLGCPAKMEKITKISKECNIPIMEDSCESHGASISNQKIGSLSLISTFSFFVAHNITTGEGGMVLTSDEQLHNSLQSIREFGRIKKYEAGAPRFYYNDEYLENYDERYVFEKIGYNVRMTDMAAAMGSIQLSKLDFLNRKRTEIANFYRKELACYSDYLSFVSYPEHYKNAYYGFPITIKPNKYFDRTTLVRFLEESKIHTRAIMAGNLSKQPAFRNVTDLQVSNNLKNSNYILDNAFFIGCHPMLNESHIQRVVNTFRLFFDKEDPGGK